MDLDAHFRALIDHDGPQPIAALMALALADPRRGYYAGRGACPIGRGGDFITAPEVSQLFGEMVGIFALQTWLDLGTPQAWQIVEFGPGRGTLLRDLLRVLKLRPSARDGLTLHLIEQAQTLRSEQKNALESWPGTVRWHTAFDTVPEAPGLFLLNEFIDCLPIHQYELTPVGWRERRIGRDEAGDLAFVLGPGGPPKWLAARLASASAGALAEWCPAGEALAADLAARLTRSPGRALFIDYGYDRPPGRATLQAVRDHKPADPLLAIGGSDLTAHVDFGALGEAAAKAGARVSGVRTQGAFLAGLGIHARAEALRRGATAAERAEIDAGLARLTGDDQMGALFKALALSSPGLPPAPGFDET